MTEKPTDTNEENIGVVPNSPVIVHKQYLKDLSFENPNAPDILRKVTNRPEMEMDISIDVNKIDDDDFENFYEVVLNVNASGRRDDKTMFIIEVSYGGAVSIEGIEESKHHPLLFVEVPQLLFPFVRHILANATLSGGFMPLQITPVNFRAMYLQRFGKKKEDVSSED